MTSSIGMIRATLYIWENIIDGNQTTNQTKSEPMAYHPSNSGEDVTKALRKVELLVIVALRNHMPKTEASKSIAQWCRSLKAMRFYL